MAIRSAFDFPPRLTGKRKFRVTHIQTATVLVSWSATGGSMRVRIFVVAMAAVLLAVAAHAQQSHWASADDKTAKYIIDMERKWAEGVCADNGVVAVLLADDFQGTS